MEYPKCISSVSDSGTVEATFKLRSELHNDRPAWDLAGSIHHSICWTPYVDGSGYGFWALANLWTLDEDKQATGIVFETPEIPIGDNPVTYPPTATMSKLPPMGWWTRGRPWSGDRTSGGRQSCLSFEG
jgi:hypothetical protein